MIAREINGERVVLLGWPCAILMQIAHPLIAAGVREHSTFRDDRLAPLRRLHATVRAMLGLTFGSEEEQAAVIARIRAIHTHVQGTLRDGVGVFPSGSRYSAEDPALLLWVHVTMLDTTVRVYERTVRPLTAGERDRYCVESAPIAVALGADAAAVPRTWDAVAREVDRAMAGPLAVGADARELAASVLHSDVMRVTGPAAWAVRQLTASWMPAALREQYRIGWGPREQARAERIEQMLRVTRRWTPRGLARWQRA